MHELEICTWILCLHASNLLRNQVRVLRQGFLSVGVGGERVHEHELEICTWILCLHASNLLRNQVEERISIAHRQQRLRFVQTHASSQATIQLEHHSLLEQVRIVCSFKLLVIWQRVDTIQASFRHHRINTRNESGKVVFEGVDGGVALALFSTFLHFFFISWPQFLKLLDERLLSIVTEAWECTLRCICGTRSGAHYCVKLGTDRLPV